MVRTISPPPVAGRHPTTALAMAAAVAILAVLLVPAAAGAAELAGTLRVLDDRGRELEGGAATAVVWFVPDAGVAAPGAGEYTMETRRKRFEPRVLVVPVGSTVDFPNRDPILHNVFSVSGGNAFDLGLVRRGEGGSHRFREAGVVRVFCNVHHSMVAYVVVVETPFYAVPEKDGDFVLEGLPAGPGTLTAWHERGEPVIRRVDPRDGPVTVAVEADRPLLPPHLNKLGRPYARRGRDRY